ncbi:unnamed protein product [Phytomonas sp. EM1]|nr:unnamed protein product [Phytomonas sp. EM1]|eukprot:CCW64962.1 unnamed protein product [Phytomonas sp. isolate EM1]
MWHSQVLRYVSAVDLYALEQRGSMLSYHFLESTARMKEAYQRLPAAQRFRLEERAASLCEEVEKMDQIESFFLVD